jgi:tetratricopeptide (TPR) repeat protein
MNGAMKNFSNGWKFVTRRFPLIGILVFGLFVAGCSTVKKFEVSGPVTDAQIAQHVKAAQAAYDSGGFFRAARYYELALARARALDDGAEIARNAYNAAACWLRAGNPTNAAPLLVEADREFAANKMDREPVLVMQAMVAAGLGQTTNAMAIAANAAAVAKSDTAQAGAILLQFSLALDAGNLGEAERLVKMASRRADKTHSVSIGASVASAEGRLLMKKSDPARAAGKFSAAANGWRDVGNIREMAAQLREAGNAFESAKKPADAAEHYYRAARSFFGQNDNVAALGCIEAALKAADEAKDEALHTQISALFSQIKKSVEGTTE